MAKEIWIPSLDTIVMTLMLIGLFDVYHGVHVHDVTPFCFNSSAVCLFAAAPFQPPQALLEVELESVLCCPNQDGHMVLMEEFDVKQTPDNTGLNLVI